MIYVFFIHNKYRKESLTEDKDKFVQINLITYKLKD